MYRGKNNKNHWFLIYFLQESKKGDFRKKEIPFVDFAHLESFAILLIS